MRAIAQAEWRPTAARYEIDIEVHRAARRGDADNFLKAAKDSLNGVIWPDDRMVSKASVTLVDGQDVGMRVRVTRIDIPAVGPHQRHQPDGGRVTAEETLTENERLALADIERLIEGRSMSYREIARRLGTSHGNVQNIEARALAKMRKRLGEP